MGLVMGSSGARAQEASSPKVDANLPEVTVQGVKDVERANGPVNGYVAKRSASGTKTDTALIETPQSISVVTRDMMSAQAVQTTEQALRYTAGVLTEVTGYDLRYQSMTIRGFAPTIYVDGMRTFASGSFGDWQSEPHGIERVEVLKGPASVLYGQGSPGGLVNQVSKRPSANAVNEVGFAVGNHDRYQATLDVGGSLNQDGTVLVRFNGLARKSATQTDYSHDDRIFLAPSLTWRPTAQTSLTLLADFTQDRVTPKSWWPDEAVLGNVNGNGRIPVSAYVGEPGFDHYDRDMSSIAYLIEHKVDDDLTLRQNTRFSNFRLDYQHVFSWGWADPLHTLIARAPLVSRTSGHALTIDNQMEANLRLGPTEHKVLAGLDLQRFAGSQDEGYGAFLTPDFDPFHPVYAAAIDPVATDHSRNALRQYGLYAQDQMRLGNLVVSAGLRHDRSNIDYTDQGEVEDSKTTYNLGVLYRFRSGLAPYASYSTSFEPANIFSRAYDPANPRGKPLKPEAGQQFELGLKYQPDGSESFITASVFDLRKQNVTNTDQVNLDGNGDAVYSVQTGEIRALGFELEATASLTRQLDLIASYTYLDAEITQTTDPDSLGKRPSQTARNTTKLWLDYKIGQGWSLAGGVRYVGKVATSDTNTAYNAAYTLADAAVHYKTGSVTVSLNAANLFNKVYTANRGQFYGQGRTLLASVAYRW